MLQAERRVAFLYELHLDIGVLFISQTHTSDGFTHINIRWVFATL